MITFLVGSCVGKNSGKEAGWKKKKKEAGWKGGGYMDLSVLHLHTHGCVSSRAWTP